MAARSPSTAGSVSSLSSPFDCPVLTRREWQRRHHERELPMGQYAQGRFTREYIKGGLAKPEDRHAALSRLCEQAGGKLVSLYFTLGQYDFIVISEMPDAKAASVLAFVAAGGGGIEGSVTTQAFTTAEAREMLAAAGRITDYKPMGAS